MNCYRYRHEEFKWLVRQNVCWPPEGHVFAFLSVPFIIRCHAAFGVACGRWKLLWSLISCFIVRYVGTRRHRMATRANSAHYRSVCREQGLDVKSSVSLCWLSVELVAAVNRCRRLKTWSGRVPAELRRPACSVVCLSCGYQVSRGLCGIEQRNIQLITTHCDVIAPRDDD